MLNNLISAELSHQLIRDDCKSFNIRKDDGWKEFVAIVRCKDCRYFNKYGFKLEYTECTNFDCPIAEDDFCSRGERREDVNIS